MSDDDLIKVAQDFRDVVELFHYWAELVPADVEEVDLDSFLAFVYPSGPVSMGHSFILMLQQPLIDGVVSRQHCEIHVELWLPFLTCVDSPK